MLVGILSDSHGRYVAVRQAVALFDRLGAKHIIHCGDVGGVEVFDELVGRPVTFVWGNMDSPDNGLLDYLRTVEIEPPSEIPRKVPLDGTLFAIFHGHEPAFNNAAATIDVDIILHGHTHVAKNENRNGKRIINPGALHRAARKTVATLDTATGELTFHEINA